MMGKMLPEFCSFHVVCLQGQMEGGRMCVEVTQEVGVIFFSDENDLKVTEKLEGRRCSWLNACVKPPSLSWTPKCLLCSTDPDRTQGRKIPGWG